MDVSAIFSLAGRAVGLLFGLYIIRGLYRGYESRRRVRSHQAQGLPTLPHSWLLGHLAILGDFRKDVPGDVNFYAFHTWLVRNCSKYFPGLDFPPPVVYLDIWPAETPLALVFDAVAASQFVQTPSLPKHALGTDFIQVFTGGLDIISNEGQEWKTWRSRFNPGFSQRNIAAMLPELLEEAAIFAAQLEDLAGKAGKWGQVFQLEEKTTNLTFDIICRAALGMRLNEQIRTESSPLKIALLDQIRVMNSGANAARAIPLGRMPWDIWASHRNNKILRDILLPQIVNSKKIGTNESQFKTITDLALKYVDKDEPNATEDSAGFTDRLIANLKAFLFAGHDTTASTICFMTKLLRDNPESLAKLRAEHDAVLGPNPEEAMNVLKSSPHVLYSLPYTLGVIKETLRLYPLAAALRRPHKGYYLTAAGSSVQWPIEGYAVWLSAPGIQRNPHYWPRPNEFLPKRWTVPEGDPLHPIHNSAFAPFSLGPRNCIGMELALIELRIVSVLMARRFDIEEAWEDWDKLRGPQATPLHNINGERLYTVGGGVVHPRLTDKCIEDGMPVHIRLREHTPAV
ncbi:vera protein [Xylariaceae sp. FL0255]|nr:vera protein [Xylariaceae sp. FL0255]